jgi:hypothetical protein
MNRCTPPPPSRPEKQLNGDGGNKASAVRPVIVPAGLARYVDHIGWRRRVFFLAGRLRSALPFVVPLRQHSGRRDSGVGGGR